MGVMTFMVDPTAISSRLTLVSWDGCGQWLLKYISEIINRISRWSNCNVAMWHHYIGSSYLRWFDKGKKYLEILLLSYRFFLSELQ